MANEAQPPASSAKAKATGSGSIDVKSDHSADEAYNILIDLEYQGFSPVEFRKEMKSKIKPSDVRALCAGYIQIGNNPDAAADVRRRKPIKDFGKGILNDDVTLARIAIAYMPIVYVLRRKALELGVLRNQFPDSKVPATDQDVCFAGWLGDALLPFLIMFDNALKKTGGDNVKHGTDQVERWMNVARSGFVADVSVASVMSKDLTEKAANDWLKSQFS